jgi:hypothetical protein
MTTAATVIASALRLYGILDQTEDPSPSDIANTVPILNDLLRSEHVDGAAQYLLKLANATVPAGSSGSISAFSIGTATGYLVKVDAVAVKSIWVQDIGPTVNRETVAASMSDIVRTTNLGRITKWNQKRQVDGSVLVSVWQPPAVPTPLLIEYGGRVAPITATDGSDVVGLPPEGIHDVTLLLGRRIFGAYGRRASDVATILADSERTHMRWQDWAKGQQWLRMVRS